MDAGVDCGGPASVRDVAGLPGTIAGHDDRHDDDLEARVG